MIPAFVTINFNPIAFSIGSLEIHWYGIMYLVGIIIGLLVAWPYAMKIGLKSDQLQTVVAIAVPAGLIGGRLYYVVQQPLGPYLAQPWRILAINEGGMAFFGAIFAVVLVILIATWKMRMSLWKLLDVAAIFAVVGQFFGRMGNIINGDVIGYQTTLPWGFIYTNPNSLAPSHIIAYQPAGVYEALINVALFLILWSLRNRFRPGVIFFLYIFGYCISQFLIFFVRDNVIYFWGLKQAQLTSLAVFAVAMALFVWFLRTQKNRIHPFLPVTAEEQPPGG